MANNHPNELAGMEQQLSLLAYQWRSQQDAALVAQYQATLRRMIELGFNRGLDAEFPDELMPTEYFDLFR